MCKISKKNIFASLLAVSMIFTMMSTTVVHAQSVKDGSNEVTVTPNVGVSYVSPEETIETRGTSKGLLRLMALQKLVLVKLVLLSFLILKAILSFILFLQEMDTHLSDM